MIHFKFPIVVSIWACEDSRHANKHGQRLIFKLQFEGCTTFFLLSSQLLQTVHAETRTKLVIEETYDLEASRKRCTFSGFSHLQKNHPCPCLPHLSPHLRLEGFVVGRYCWNPFCLCHLCLPGQKTERCYKLVVQCVAQPYQTPRRMFLEFLKTLGRMIKSAHLLGQWNEDFVVNCQD
jgi:hypothetical protein